MDFYRFQLQIDQPESDREPKATYVVDPSAQPQLLPIVERGLHVLHDTAASRQSNTRGHNLFTSTCRYDVAIPCRVRDETGRVFWKLTVSQGAPLPARPLKCPECNEMCAGVMALRDHIDRHVRGMYQQREESKPTGQLSIRSPCIGTSDESTLPLSSTDTSTDSISPPSSFADTSFEDSVSTDISSTSILEHTHNDKNVKCPFCPNALPNLTELAQHKKRDHESVKRDACRRAPIRQHIMQIRDEYCKQDQSCLEEQCPSERSFLERETFLSDTFQQRDREISCDALSGCHSFATSSPRKRTFTCSVCRSTFDEDFVRRSLRSPEDSSPPQIA